MEGKHKFLHGTLEATIFHASPYKPPFLFNVSINVSWSFKQSLQYYSCLSTNRDRSKKMYKFLYICLIELTGQIDSKYIVHFVLKLKE